MRTLPRELQPWEPYLAFLDPILVPALGRLADEVLRALRNVGTEQPHEGEPSGWSGLDRRGPLERLLLTDWALSELAPDEFLRRTTQGELLFWQRERATSPLGGTCRLLLDCGPLQVGACRVVQLALLVVLARRAQEAGRRFAWCVGQDVARQHEGLSGNSIRSFLQARSCSPVSDDAVRSFCERAEEKDELWLAGSPEFLQRHQGRPFMLALEQLSPESVRLTLQRRAQILTMPSRECVRLLRDPFRQAQSPVQSSAVPGDFDFSADGRKLIVRAPGQMVVYPIPNSPNDQPGLPRAYAVDPAYVVLAAGMHHTDMVTMQAGRGTWSFWRLTRQERNHKLEISWPAENRPVGPLGRVWLEPPDRPALRAELKHFSTPDLYVANGKLRLKEYAQGQPELLEFLCRHSPRAMMLLDGGLFTSHPSHGLVRIADVQASLGKSLLVIGTTLFERTRPLLDIGRPITRPTRVFLGYGGHHGLKEALDCVATLCAEDSCWVHWRGGMFGLVVKDVVGVLSNPHQWKTPAAVTLEGPALQLHGKGWTKHVEFPDVLEKVTFCPTAPSIAYRTAAGELGVYSFPHGRFLLRVSP